jgi:prepilin-type N-terminal cleavage/methylation domain-containing protein
MRFTHRFGTRGYTLIEMIVAVSIIGIMTAIVIGTFSVGKQQDTLRAESDKLGSAFRSTRNRGVNGATHIMLNGSGDVTKVCSLSLATDCSPGDSICTDPDPDLGHCVSTLYPPGGYGISLDTDDNGRATYTIFANLDAGTGPPFFDNMITEPVQKVTLPNSMELTLPLSATEAEYIFTDSGVVYHYNSGTWSTDTDETSYPVIIQHQNGCDEIGKRSVVTIDKSPLRIYEELQDCP